MGRDERPTDDSVLDRQTKSGLLSQKLVTWIKLTAIRITEGLLGMIIGGSLGFPAIWVVGRVV